MTQSGGFNIIDLMNPLRVMSKIVYKAEDLCNKVSLNDIIKATVTSRKIIKDLKKFFGTGAETLTNNEIKYIINVIKSLENRGTLLKETTRKVTNQEEGFLDFIRSLKTAGLPLMKNVLTPLTKVFCYHLH